MPESTLAFTYRRRSRTLTGDPRGRARDGASVATPPGQAEAETWLRNRVPS